MRFPDRANIYNLNSQRVAISSGSKLALVLAAGLSMSGCASLQISSAVPTASAAPTLTGRVHGGTQPISASTIQLYAVGATGNGSAATPLLTSPVVSDAQGNFTITGLYTCPTITTMVYLTATGGNPGLGAGGSNSTISLMAALGACAQLSSSSFININEVTTVGAVWSLQQFMTSSANVGGPAGSVGLQNAFVNSAMLVNTATGTTQPSAVIGAAMVQAINTIADALAACINTNGGTGSTSNCGALFAATTPTSGSAPGDTVGAALNLALNPTLNRSAIFNLVGSAPPFQPVAATVPQDYSLGFTSTSPTTFATGLNSVSVFIGDSITAGWPLPIHNKGVNSQHAAEISARFNADVLGQGYSRVIILAGTNDVWFPDSTSGYAVSTIKTMAELARSNGIQPILCLIGPIEPYTGNLNSQVVDFNAQLQAVAAYDGMLLVDYYTPLLPVYPADSKDGVHPTADGYALMESALSAVVTR